MKVTRQHRRRLVKYLKAFYKHYPEEKYTIFHFVRYFKERLKNKKDTWMGITGDTGTGKSLFAIMTQILFGRPYDLRKNISYIPKGNEIANKLDKLEFQTFLVDEAAQEMRAVNWQSKPQQKVNTKAMTERFKNNWIMLNMPNFMEFTKSMRNTNLQFRAITAYRTSNYARIIIQMRSRNWRSQDRWYDKKAEEKYEKAIKRRGALTNEDVLKIERELPNTIMDFIVPNLEKVLPEVTNEYERLKRESRKEDDQQEEERDPWKERYEKIFSRAAKIVANNELQLGKIKVSREEMAKAFGVSLSTFMKYLKMPQKEKPPVLNQKINK